MTARLALEPPALLLACALIPPLAAQLPLLGGWLRAHPADVTAALLLYLPLAVIGREPISPGDPDGLQLDLEQCGLTTARAAESAAVALATMALITPAFAFAWWLASRGGPAWFHPPFAPHAPPRLATTLLFQLVYVALPEEWFFRGYVQARWNRLWRARIVVLGTPVGWAVPAAAALFALAHPLVARSWSELASPAGWLSLDTFFPGLLFGWLRERTGSLVAPVLVHCACNLLLLSFL